MSMSMEPMEPCRFGTGCWRPLCPFGHSGRGRAARWTALWSLLAKQEAEDEVILEEHISERTQIVDIPVPLDRPGDKARRLPTDTIHRQGYCRHACCDTATDSVTAAQPSVELPQTQYTDKVVAVPLVIQRQVPRTPTFSKTVQVLSAQLIASWSVSSNTLVMYPCLRFANKLWKSTKTPQKHISERIAEQTVDVPTPQILEEIVEAISAPHERVQQRTVEHVATVKTVPQDRIPETICELIVDAPVPLAVDEPLPSFPSFQEEIDGTIKPFPIEHIPERNGDHIVDVPMPLTMEEAAMMTTEEYNAFLKSIVERYSTR